MAAMVAAVDPSGFPNGLMGPVRGWRSWNAVFSDITQDFMTRQVLSDDHHPVPVCVCVCAGVGARVRATSAYRTYNSSMFVT